MQRVEEDVKIPTDTLNKDRSPYARLHNKLERSGLGIFEGYTLEGRRNEKVTDLQRLGGCRDHRLTDTPRLGETVGP